MLAMQSVSLSDLADEHLEIARGVPSGRSGYTIHGGQGHLLRHTLIALIDGHSLDEHNSPAEGTLLVLRGRVRMASVNGDELEGGVGDYLLLPRERHDLQAIGDAVVLLTVALHPNTD